MSGNPMHTDTAFDLLGQLSDLLAQAQALVVVADCDGLQGLRGDLLTAYMVALHNIVVDARAVVEKLTTEAAA